MNNVNTKKYIVVLFIIVVTAYQTSSVFAGNADRYWSKQAESKQDVMQLWKHDAPLVEIGQAIYQLGKYEVYLVGVNPAYAKDSRMVMNLVEDPKIGVNSSQDLYRLSYWIVLHELKQKFGYMPSAQRLFETNRFKIWER